MMHEYRDMKLEFHNREPFSQTYVMLVHLVVVFEASVVIMHCNIFQ